MEHMEVSAGVIWRQGKFLACKRPSGKPLAGYWELPGGKLEPGESAPQALMRELYEELGISCRDCEFLATVEHTWQDALVVLHFFEVNAFHGEPASREGQELRWVHPSEITDMEFLPVDEHILPMLLDKCK